MMLDNTISTLMFVPMAISLAFGVLVGTFITLFIVPCLYLALEDVKALAGQASPKSDPDDRHGANQAG